MTRCNVIGRSLVLSLLLLLLHGCSAERPHTRFELTVPHDATAHPPALLSQVGVFREVRTLEPAPGLVAYDVNVPFWSDGAAKRRWILLPAGQKVHFAETGSWTFPPGTVFVKHFEFPGRRIETRVLVRDRADGVFGFTYRWRVDQSDADLVTDALMAGVGSKQWYFPSSQDCKTCHTPGSGGVLGVNTRQLNGPSPDGAENQLVAFSRTGLLDAKHIEPDKLNRLHRVDDEQASVGDRARSYLDANCANCHRPGGVAGNFDARFETPPEKQNLVGGPVLINLGVDHARTIAPGDVWRSIALTRMQTIDGTRMPPLGHLTVDANGVTLLREWIASLPGPKVLEPPTIQPAGGEFRGQLAVKLSHADPHAKIHYTLDGSLPVKSSPVYSDPIVLTEPVTLRARAFADGMMQSVGVQETYIVNDDPK
jgi:uncharacterized repeat protein (TIGR03806 family)